MSNEKWNEICFLLSDNIRKDISESDFEQQVWSAHRFRETSGVLGNLRSRPEFRNGKWQELGIEKVYVSIEK